MIEQVGYDPERDTENPADSVFCAHGAGYNVKWDEVPAHAHVESGVRLNESEEEETPAARSPGGRQRRSPRWRRTSSWQPSSSGRTALPRGGSCSAPRR